MVAFLFHERLYRAETVMEKIHSCKVTICGAGALGANITETLARSGFGRLKVIDFDRVEERNLSTQPYFRSDIGAFKAKILSNSLYRALGTSIEVSTETLTADNAKKLLAGANLVIDAFDNSRSRQIVTDFCSEAGLECLHAGLAGDYSEVIWNEKYRVPSSAGDDVCDYPLARNLVLLTVAVACEVITIYLATGEKHNFTVTLRDLSVTPISF